MDSVTPFLIVDDLDATLEFYQFGLGFKVLYWEVTDTERTSGLSSGAIR